jgi:hypothetical protein
MTFVLHIREWVYWSTELITLVRSRNVSSTALCRGRLGGISRTICLNAADFALSLLLIASVLQYLHLP